ncbi:unnamed protein product [Soboliphyme baturini]|uniref:Zpr1 domain-containing protein n=1 Tax=Soboliphyme baturini TaxID=241478 RepID=A0A183IT72_9BILA|nr:unnamed protein product [Soboliphyme baturini]
MCDRCESRKEVMIETIFDQNLAAVGCPLPASSYVMVLVLVECEACGVLFETCLRRMSKLSSYSVRFSARRAAASRIEVTPRPSVV